jgi:hypothetical protein
MSLALYKFYWDCGRYGDVEGLFVADESEVASCIGKEVYFGEILGKHSDVYASLEWKDLTLKSNDQEFILKLFEIMGNNTISGYNPLEHIDKE